MTKTDKPKRRPPKKTEALEIRLSPEEKSAFLDACRKMGRSASAVIRDAMRAYANFGPMARLPGSPIMIISAFAGAALGAFALIQLTQATDPEPAERLYGMEEYTALDRNFDHAVSLLEYQQAEGSARDILANVHDGRALSAGRAGLVGGLMIGAGLDPLRFSDQPDSIGEGCWSAVNAYFAEFQQQRFNHWDQNGDGYVTPQELSAVRLAQLRRNFLDSDRNGDGLISGLDDGLPERALAPETRQALYGNSRLTSRPQDACGLEVEMPRLQNPPMPESDAARDMLAQFQAEQRRFYDLDRDGVITFEEFLALRS